MARATTSLPAPLSPSMSTVVVSEAASRPTMVRTCSIAAEWPTSASMALAARRSVERAAICRRVREVARARSTAATRVLSWKGLTRKSMAPCFMASTATSTVLWADIISTATSGWMARARCSVTTPSMPGSLTSSSMTSGGEAPTSSSACSPDSAESTS
jgi:hypothetical protein